MTPRIPLTRRLTSAARWTLAATALALLTTSCTGDRVAGPAPARVLAQEKGDNWGQRGRVVDATLLKTIDPDAVTALIAQAGVQSAYAARYAVEQWSFTYTTIDVNGDPVVASGALYLPVGATEPLPMISFSHGFVTNKVMVPSTGLNAQQANHGFINASGGAVTVLADYLGLGADAAHLQQFHVASVAASASLDALRAARRFARERAYELDGRLFVYGYSQGGPVAMALVRQIQEEPRAAFHVTAAALIAGPYDLYGTARSFLAPDRAPYAPASVILVSELAAFDHAYALASCLCDIVQPPYDAVAERLLAVGMTQAQANAAVPALPRNALTAAATDAILDDPDAPISRALRANDTYDWRPAMPMRLYYGTADLDVPFQNALTALARMTELGAPDVQAVDLGPLNHGGVQIPAYIAMRQWWDTFPAPVATAEGGD